MRGKIVITNGGLKGCILWYDFRRLAASDYGPLGDRNAATLYGGASLDATEGLVLDGATGYALVATVSADFNFGTGGITYFARVKDTALPVSQRHILSKYGNPTNNLTQFHVSTTHTPAGYFRDSAGVQLNKTMSAGQEINDSNWHSIAMVRNGTTITVYKDVANSESNTAGTFNAINLSSATYPLTIGAFRGTAGAYSNYWLGSIRSLIIFNRALTVGEIAYLHGIGA